MFDESHITVVAGPSGVGKSTVVDLLAARYPRVWVSVSDTTRSPRPHEIDGVDYNFITVETFKKLIAEDEFLEYANVYGGDYYGTPKSPILKALNEDCEVVMILDAQGAQQVKKLWPQANFVFMLPPSWEQLKERLSKRGTESVAAFEKRLEAARYEISHKDDYPHQLVNSHVEDAVWELAKLLKLNEE